MASSYFKTLLQRQLTGFTRSLSSEAVWLVPAGLGAGWLLWPCIDLEWKIEMGLAKDPESDIFMIQEAKNKRYEAKFGKRPDAKEEVEEEEEEEEEEAEEESGDQEAGSGDGDDAGDDDAGDDEEEEEEAKIVVPPLYVPTKGKLSTEQVWDNFTIKAVNWLADDDDDEDEDDE